MAVKTLVAWSLSVFLGATAFGLAWLTTTTQVPLWGLLVLTFVPTTDLISFVRQRLGQTKSHSETSDS